MAFKYTLGGITYSFADLKTLLARATPLRSGDVLAGVAASTAQERVAAQHALAETPLAAFLSEAVIPYEDDEVTRLIVDSHDRAAFAPISHLTVGGLRDWLLSPIATAQTLAQLAPGLTPEMAAAAVKIMRLQDLVIVGQKCRVVTRFRNTIGLAGRLSTRLQPNHPTDDVRGVAASLLDGLLLGAGDAVIGINPATDNVYACARLLEMIEDFRTRFDMPSQSCVLAHITTTMQAMQRGAPVDLVFQSIAGSQAANKSFGIDLALIAEAREMALALRRGTLGDNVMYFETGQGSALSANAHHGVDQQTIEARAYAVARAFSPLLVNTVVGFIGPEYLFDGKQIVRAGLEDHCCAKLLGLPMGCDICYTNHAEADQDDMDALLTLLGTAGCTFIMGVPGADDIMLNYQSTSFHDALYIRRALGKRPAPEFEAWLEQMGIVDGQGGLRAIPDAPEVKPLVDALAGAATDLVSARPNDLSSQALWDRLREFTPARIGIQPTGVSQPTPETLSFRWDHAQARDAVYSELDTARLLEEAQSLGFDAIAAHSLAKDRGDYVKNPDRGRLLDDASRDMLSAFAKACDLAFVVADGLSATAVDRNAIRVLSALRELLPSCDWNIGPLVIVGQGRVAVGDDIAVALGAEMVVVLIGERPGLCSPSSLGAYITFRPRLDSKDSERNCVSNIHSSGLSAEVAASRIAYLLRTARRLGLTGVGLKENARDDIETSAVRSLAGAR